MKKTDNPVVNVYGNNNDVKIKVIVTETTSKTPVAVAIAIAMVVAASVLTVSLCCPELLADFVRWIVSLVIGR